MTTFCKTTLLALTLLSIVGAILLTNTMGQDSYSRLLDGITTFSIGILAVAGAWFAVMIPEYLRLVRTVRADQLAEKERIRTEVDANLEELSNITSLQRKILLPITLSSLALAFSLLLTIGMVLFPHIAQISWMQTVITNSITPLSILKFLGILCVFLLYQMLLVSIFTLILSPTILSNKLNSIYNTEELFTRLPRNNK